MQLKAMREMLNSKLILMMSMAGLVLAGCGQSASSAGEPTAAAGNTYELVQLVRPEPADGPFRVVKETAYKMCSMMAELKHLPVKPFPNPPAGYATERITVVTDGKSFVRKSESLYSTDTSTITPENGCEYKISPSKAYSVTLLHGGKQIDISAADDGKATVDTTDAGTYTASSTSGKASDFSEQRTVNGVNLRCWPKSHPMLANGLLLDMCIYEKDGVLVESNQQPITLYSKTRPAGKDPRFPYVVITEPVSLRQVTDGAAKRFQAESYSQ